MSGPDRNDECPTQSRIELNFNSLNEIELHAKSIRQQLENQGNNIKILTDKNNQLENELEKVNEELSKVNEINSKLGQKLEDKDEEIKNLKAKYNETMREWELEKQEALKNYNELYELNNKLILEKEKLMNRNNQLELEKQNMEEDTEKSIDNLEQLIDQRRNFEQEFQEKYKERINNIRQKLDKKGNDLCELKEEYVKLREASIATSLGDEFRVVVGLDFGTTYSGFTYCHVGDVSNKLYTTNEEWPDDTDYKFKTNTVLQYEENLTDVKSWGYPALSKSPKPGFDGNKKDHVVELFKLQLGNLNTDLKKKYELSVNYEKAITDYLREIGNLIKNTVKDKWEDIEFFENVLLVLTVPAEYTERAKAIMRKCAYNAGLIDDINSVKLQFTTEPEAAAIYCMEICPREYDLVTIGTTFMIVDSGGGTVDLTTVKLVNENQLDEVTERAGDYCGSAFIDDEFIKYLTEELGGKSVMDLLRNNYYGQLQYLVQEFCQHVKMPFTGDDPTFVYEMDLGRVSPVLLQHVSDEVRQRMEDAEWSIKLDYEKIKSMFDPVIKRILRMISVQLENCSEKCSTMFLVGGFSQSKYLQKRIRQKFDHKVRVHVPTNPIAAVSRGAAIYGLSVRNMEDDDLDGLMFVVNSRILTRTYGLKIYSPWKEGDPIERKDELFRFHVIGKTGDDPKKAKRGTIVSVDEEFTVHKKPTLPSQTREEFEIYYTRNYAANYCDESDMMLLGKLKVDWPDVHLGLDRSITFTLAFGRMEIKAMARNEKNGQYYQITFKIDE